MNSTSDTFDILIAGGGPAGAVCALTAARAGLRVCVLEKSRHPRFHIGESMLPVMTPLMRQLGMAEKLNALPHALKLGAEFGFGNDPKTMRFNFNDGLIPGQPVFNIERSIFDQMLIEEARSAGAEIRENTPVTSIEKLSADGVELTAGGKTLRARLLLDCSGHATIVGRRLKIRKPLSDEKLHKAAYFQHFENVQRDPGPDGGNPTILMSDEGWFWIIPLSDTKTSVGFVAHPSLAKCLNIPARQMLRWALARCPVARERMSAAIGPAGNEVLADFSYRCDPMAGDGYFLVGDAARFLDPVFSTGVSLAMLGGQRAAQLAVAVVQGAVAARRAQRQYINFVSGATDIFWGIIKAYYRHSFRELFMEGSGPMQVHKAIIALLAGQVFPKPIWALRWRLYYFHACVAAQEYLPLVPHRKRFSLRDEPALAEQPAALAGAS